jgi:DNA-binding NarL/FixJ family response regulator
VMCVALLAGTAVDLGDGERAARLLAAAQQVWRMFGLPSFGSPFYTDDHRRTTELARSLLGPAAYSAAVDAGAAMSLDDLVAYALDRRPAPARLTRREREVASLVAAGLSNKDIADRLVVTARTVDSHVAHILAKLGFSSRAQIAAWVVENR